MKRISLLVGCCSLLLSPLHADENTRSAQEALKSAGFYYGPITGERNEETLAAVRRFQIRNGLAVTGELNAETQEALGGSPTQAPEQSPPVQSPVEPRNQERPPTPTPRDARGDRDARELVPEEEEDGPVPPGASDHSSRREPLIPFEQIFIRTPYQRAPLPVQQQTLRNAQEHLSKRGYYDGPIDSVPTQRIRRSLASFQDSLGLKPTGNLDVDTLHEMRLLPGESGSGFRTNPHPQRRIYRGIEVR